VEKLRWLFTTKARRARRRQPLQQQLGGDSALGCARSSKRPSCPSCLRG